MYQKKCTERNRREKGLVSGAELWEVSSRKI